MRKHSKRLPRPVSSLLTPAQHSELLLVPRIHLEMVLTSAANLQHQHSVMSVFNIAFALASIQQNPHLQHQFDAAQKMMLALINGARTPSRTESDFLRQCFNYADRHIGIQNKETLARAVAFVDRMISNENLILTGQQ